MFSWDSSPDPARVSPHSHFSFLKHPLPLTSCCAASCCAYSPRSSRNKPPPPAPFSPRCPTHVVLQQVGVVPLYPVIKDGDHHVPAGVAPLPGSDHIHLRAAAAVPVPAVLQGQQWQSTAYNRAATPQPGLQPFHGSMELIYQPKSTSQSQPLPVTHRSAPTTLTEATSRVSSGAHSPLPIIPSLHHSSHRRLLAFEALISSLHLISNKFPLSNTDR